MNLDELKKIIFDAGICGAGGAGFPTYLKLADGIDTVIVNAAECEPLLKADKAVLIAHFKELGEALDVLVEALQADSGIIALKGKNLHYIEDKIPSLLSSYKKLSVKEIRDIYPAGDEVVLTYEVTGRVVPEVSIPRAVGVAVVNAETLFNIYNALNGKPVTKKYITIAGEVPKPTTFYVPLGTSIKELIIKCGLTNFEDHAFINGGPLMGPITKNIENEYVTKTSKGIIVLPKNHSHILKKSIKPSVAAKRGAAACCHCTMCTDMCPRHLLGHSLEVHKVVKAVGSAITNDPTPYYKSQLCCGCGICDYISCQQDINPRVICGEVKGQMLKNNMKYKGKTGPFTPLDEREFRLIPSSRIVSRCNLDKYNVDAPLTSEEVRSDRLFLKLRQHIGKPAEVCVAEGDTVSEGTVLAAVNYGDVGANIHSSADGVVEKIQADGIWIKTNVEV